MAILNVKLPTNLTEYPNSFKRQGSFPLEAYSVFYAITDAEGAITTSALDAAKDYAKNNPVAYVGQILAVVTVTEGISEVDIYKIENKDGDLLPVGNTEEVEAAIQKLEEYIGEIPEGSNAKTLVELISEVEGKIPTVPTNISAFNNDSKYQTDVQVQAIVSAAIAETNHAAFQKVDAVPSAEEAGANILYLVSNGDKMDIYAKIGEEVVLIDDTDADLSGYAKTADLEEFINKSHEHGNADVLKDITAEKVAAWDEAEKNVISSVDEAQFNIDADRKLTILDIAQDKISGLKNAAGNEITLEAALAGKVDKHGTDRLITAEEAAKLELLVIDEETGQAAISGTVNASQVQGLSELLADKVDKVDGMGLSANNFTNELLGKLNGIESNAQVNIIEVIKINGVALEVTDKAVDIPVATESLLGVVKSSVAENKVSVTNDGTMEVNSINVNKLTQTDGDTLILNGGSSAI